MHLPGAIGRPGVRRHTPARQPAAADDGQPPYAGPTRRPRRQITPAASPVVATSAASCLTTRSRPPDGITQGCRQMAAVAPQKGQQPMLRRRGCPGAGERAGGARAAPGGEFAFRHETRRYPESKLKSTGGHPCSL